MQGIFVRSIGVTFLGLVWILTGSLQGSQAQSRDYYRLVQQYQRPQIYYESVVLPDSGEVGKFGLTFRIPHAGLVFTKTPRQESQGEFLAEVEIAVDIFEGSDRVDTRVVQRNHYVSSYEETQARTRDLTGALWFDLPPGEYRYEFEVTDQNTEQRRRETPRSHRMTIPSTNQWAVHKTLLARGIDTAGNADRMELYNLSGDIAYGASAHAVVPVSIPSEHEIDDLSIHYRLRKLTSDAQNSLVRRRGANRFRPEIAAVSRDEKPETGPVIRSDTLSIADLRRLRDVAISDSSGTELTLRRASSERETNLLALLLDLRGEQLTNDIYALEVEIRGVDDESSARTTYFAAHWRDMPASLYDLEVAIDHLAFIAERETIEWIESGDREERFRAYWKKRDPTPDTPFNELMAEYYQRVDDAADRFRSGRSPVPDGLRSDRARVYIVNGPPSSKERTIPRRGIVRETWTYDNGRTFVFEASSGFDTFQLVDEES